MTKKSISLSLCDRPHNWKEDPSDPIEPCAEVIEAEDLRVLAESYASKRDCSDEVHDAIEQFEDILVFDEAQEFQERGSMERSNGLGVVSYSSPSVISKSPLLRAFAK